MPTVTLPDASSGPSSSRPDDMIAIQRLHLEALVAMVADFREFFVAMVTDDLPDRECPGAMLIDGMIAHGVLERSTDIERPDGTAPLLVMLPAGLGDALEAAADALGWPFAPDDLRVAAGRDVDDELAHVAAVSAALN